MGKKKALDLKVPKSRREALRRAIYGDVAEMKELALATVLALYGEEQDPEWKEAAENVLRQLAAAAANGDSDVFRNLAACVARQHELGAHKQGRTRWSDPISAKLIEAAGGLHGGEFNVSEWMRRKGIHEDPKTVRGRVKAFGFKRQVGRPKGQGNLPH